ncbi:MAG: TIGR02680 family protein, partial [Pseudomonadota bacterium]|nr:TIGR02680 family protein [Pseudomonadota bacterium]
MNTPDRPALPSPNRSRWQPLRLGLVELFHYDSEEFWFRDGHLLLRGNNGTGKSKVLSLTLPFLFDAQLKSSRVEPDGDPGKKMGWNLLMGRHDRRIGYAWIEFGRVAESGVLEYFTLGCGLSAAAARPQVDSWFFVLDGQRIGQDLWLTSPQRVVLTRERLRSALQDRGQVFDTAETYRRAVDERLFHLGKVRYGALMDTLVQLRQPQLSKKPDEGSLSNALTEALPPMSADLLTDVADALSQLEEYRRELEEYEALERAVGQFNRRYRDYASTQARRQARSLRSAQTGFDVASRTLNEGRTALLAAQDAEALAREAHGDTEAALAASRTRLEQLQADPGMQDANRLEQAARDAQ